MGRHQGNDDQVSVNSIEQLEDQCIRHTSEYIIATEILGYVESTTPPDIDGRYGNDLLLLPDKDYLESHPFVADAFPRRGRINPLLLCPKFKNNYEIMLRFIDALSEAGIETSIKYSRGLVCVSIRGSSIATDITRNTTTAFALSLSNIARKLSHEEKKIIRQKFNQPSPEAGTGL
jgi:hypothetical protein